jgi:hypothetical protein
MAKTVALCCRDPDALTSLSLYSTYNDRPDQMHMFGACWRMTTSDHSPQSSHKGLVSLGIGKASRVA